MSTFEELKKLFEDVLDNANTANITEDSLLTDDLGINSVGLLYMAVAVEEKFGVQFKNDDFPNIRKVSDVIGIIESRQK